MEASHCRPDTRRHPGMHRTATLRLHHGPYRDAVTLLLDDDEIDLKPFDVRRSTWDEPCLGESPGKHPGPSHGRVDRRRQMPAAEN